ncbi:MAG TPA: thioredoxin [Porphyromonadaceae bacterium]|nr:thioredoxin [Porphyromonadaceae bacterium]
MIMAQKITDANYKELLAQDKLVVVDFWAEWCGPCRSIAPAVDELAAEFEGKAIIGKYNVDDDNALSSEMGIRNIPTLLFFKGGKLVDKQVGASSKADLKAKIEANL